MYMHVYIYIICIYIMYIYLSIYIYIHVYMHRRKLPKWLRNICKKNVFFIILENNRTLLRGRYIHPQTRVSSFPGLISVARVNE